MIEDLHEGSSVVEKTVRIVLILFYTAKGTMVHKYLSISSTEQSYYLRMTSEKEEVTSF